MLWNQNSDTQLITQKKKCKHSVTEKNKTNNENKNNTDQKTQHLKKNKKSTMKLLYVNCNKSKQNIQRLYLMIK